MNNNENASGVVRVGMAMALVASVAVAGAWQAQPEKKDPPSEKPKEATPAEKPKDTATNPATPAKGEKAAEPGKSDKPAGKAGDPYVLGYKMKSIDGKEVDLASFKGKVVMILNVASECGLTVQYRDLQKLYEQKKDKGFVILGFPANNFGGQEPGSDETIAKFCKEQFSVTFPMFSKISVKGTDVHPLYKQLAAVTDAEPDWNFTKYLVDRDGKVVQRFAARTKPDDAALLKKIDELLAAPVKADPPKNN